MRRGEGELEEGELYKRLVGVGESLVEKGEKK